MTSSLLFAVFVDQIHQFFAEDALILLPHGLDGLLERGLVDLVDFMDKFEKENLA